MPIRLHFNASALFANHSLGDANRLLEISLARLSSGMRIQRAGDDPSGLAIANGMRHHLRGLEQATANSESGVALIQTAEGAMDQISTLLIKARSLAVSAANLGANDQPQLDAYQTELDELLASMDQIATRTSFAGRYLLQGDLAQTTLPESTRSVYSAVQLDHRALPGGVADGSTLSFGPPSTTLTRDRISAGFGAGTPATQTIQGATQAGTVLDNASGGSLTITGPRGASTISIGVSTTIADVAALINGNTSLTGARAAYDSVTGQLTVDSEDFGGGTLSITASDMTSGGTTIGLLDSDSSSAANSLYVAGTTPTLPLTFTDAAGDSHSITLILDSQSNGGLDFISTGGGPESTPPYTGWGDGAFRISLRDTSDGSVGSSIAPSASGHTATRTSAVRIQTGGRSGESIAVEVSDLRTAALGRVPDLLSEGITSLADAGSRRLLALGNAEDALRLIDAAINEVSTARGRAGAIQGDALEPTLDSLRVAMENLISAEGRIRDTDMALESAEYAKQNIRLQAATSMLAQANQVPQALLQLLQ